MKFEKNAGALFLTRRKSRYRIKYDGNNLNLENNNKKNCDLNSQNERIFKEKKHFIFSMNESYSIFFEAISF